MKISKDIQPDLICGQCPLSKCQEESLFCLYRLLTKPNLAQRKFVTVDGAARKTVRHKDGYFTAYRAEHKAEKREYDREYYERNRTRILNAAKRRKMTADTQRETPDNTAGFINSEATDNPLNETTSIASPCAGTAVSKE